MMQNTYIRHAQGRRLFISGQCISCLEIN